MNTTATPPSDRDEIDETKVELPPYQAPRLTLVSSPEDDETDAVDESDPVDSSPDETLQRIKDLPRELGVLLVSVGVLGLALPGLAGAPAVIAGGLVLWPKAFGGIENWFQRRYPVVHRKSMQQLGRYLDDMDRRYPPTENS